MTKRIARVGHYRVYFWQPITPIGRRGWVIERFAAGPGFGEIVGKFDTKADAIAEAARLDILDRDTRGTDAPKATRPPRKPRRSGRST